MQFDQTRIAIRERSLTAILDLALHVVRADFAAWLLWLTLGALPMLILDFGLLLLFVEPDEPDLFLAQMAALSLLLAWQLPLATAPLTLYLGQAVFAARPGARKVLGDLWRAAPQLTWFQGLRRALLLPWGFTWFFLFVSRQFLNEVILLERTPLRSPRQGVMSTSRRAWALHAGVQSDLFFRWIMSLLFGLVLLAALSCAALSLGGALWGSDWGRWGWSLALGTVLLAWWAAIGYFTVVRFLSYVDLRIRREGWEVELLMRAEAARLSNRWS